MWNCKFNLSHEQITSFSASMSKWSFYLEKNYSNKTIFTRHLTITFLKLQNMVFLAIRLLYNEFIRWNSFGLFCHSSILKVFFRSWFEVLSFSYFCIFIVNHMDVFYDPVYAQKWYVKIFRTFVLRKFEKFLKKYKFWVEWCSGKHSIWFFIRTTSHLSPPLTWKPILFSLNHDLFVLTFYMFVIY